MSTLTPTHQYLYTSNLTKILRIWKNSEHLKKNLTPDLLIWNFWKVLISENFQKFRTFQMFRSLIRLFSDVQIFCQVADATPVPTHSTLTLGYMGTNPSWVYPKVCLIIISISTTIMYHVHIVSTTHGAVVIVIWPWMCWCWPHHHCHSHHHCLIVALAIVWVTLLSLLHCGYLNDDNHHHQVLGRAMGHRLSIHSVGKELWLSQWWWQSEVRT